MVKNLLANGDVGSIPGSERSPGEGNDNAFPEFLPGKSHRKRGPVGYLPCVPTSGLPVPSPLCARVWAPCALSPVCLRLGSMCPLRCVPASGLHVLSPLCARVWAPCALSPVCPRPTPCALSPVCPRLGSRLWVSSHLPPLGPHCPETRAHILTPEAPGREPGRAPAWTRAYPSSIAM